MSSERLDHLLHLFSLCHWSDNLSEGGIKWCGKVSHVLSGESCWLDQLEEPYAQPEDILLFSTEPDQRMTPDGQYRCDGVRRGGLIKLVENMAVIQA